MKTLSRATTLTTMAALLATQPGCVTQALLSMGEGSNPASPPVQQPVAYTGVYRDGRILHLEYDTTVDSDGKQHSDKASAFNVDLGTLNWQNLGPAPIDPYCTADMWMKLLPNAPPQPRAPLLPGRPNDIAMILGVHKQYATGFPPLSLHVNGLDTWIVCGAGDWIGYAQAPMPPPPHPGSDGTRHPGYIVAIVLLFPFALTADILGGAIYVLAHAR